MAKASMAIIGGHIGGLKDQTHHLTYRPGYTKPDGKVVQPRVKLTVFCNEVRDTGPAKPDSIIIWSGMPWIVWLLTKGKSISIDNLRRRSYLTRTYDNANNILKNPDNTEVQTKRYEFIVRDVVNDIHLGNDSLKFSEALTQHAAAEVAAGKRPADWDTPGTPGATEWRILEWMRNHTPYQAGETFGYAKVEPIPQGCVIDIKPVPADLRQQALNAINRNSGGSPTVVTGTGVVTGPGTGAGSLGTIQIEGYTMAQYVASGWSEEQLRADAKFAAFFAAPTGPAGPGTVPAPPETPAETTVVTGV